VLGFGALAFAITGWIRHEHPRVWLGALFLATAALAWEFVLVAVVIAFLLLLLCSVASNF